MPTVKRFNNCKITVYIGDHNPPHFHIVGTDCDAMVEIDTMRVIRGVLPKALDALNWAKANDEIIRAEWERCNGRKD
jgi:hypothetical protein